MLMPLSTQGCFIFACTQMGYVECHSIGFVELILSRISQVGTGMGCTKRGSEGEDVPRRTALHSQPDRWIAQFYDERKLVCGWEIGGQVVRRGFSLSDDPADCPPSQRLQSAPSSLLRSSSN